MYYDINKTKQKKSSKKKYVFELTIKAKLVLFLIQQDKPVLCNNTLNVPWEKNTLNKLFQKSKNYS